MSFPIFSLLLMPLLVIVGAGDLGRETAALVENVNARLSASDQWDLVGFVDDAPALQQATVQGLPVCGSVDWLCEQKNLHYVIAVGTPRVRRRLHRRLRSAPLTPTTLRPPSVALHRTTTLGPGCIIAPGVTMTVSVTLARWVIVDLHCSLSHDVVVGDYATLHPGVCLTGHVTIDAGAELGTGCVVLPGITVGEDAVVGAGAVVHRDVPPGCTVAGVPARPLVK